MSTVTIARLSAPTLRSSRWKLRRKRIPSFQFNNFYGFCLYAPAVLTGEHFINGDTACAEGALAAGCRFFAGYPITPATEIAEQMAKRLPEVGGVFIQMEDEIAAMAAVLGASCAGTKSMTATSGLGSV